MENYPPQPTRRSLVSLLSWPMMIFLGWLVYELTARPAFGAAVTVAKFGWNDLLTAIWLRRLDANRGRGKACFWMYVAFGFSKCGATAFIMLAAALCFLPLVILFLPAQGNFGEQTFLECLFTCLGAFALSWLATLIGLCYCRRNNTKVWLNPCIHRSREADIWPPQNVGMRNFVDMVVYSGGMLGNMGLQFGLILVGFWIGELLPIAFQRSFFIMGFVLLIGLFNGGIAFASRHEKFFAKTPEECWQPERVVQEESMPQQE